MDPMGLISLVLGVTPPKTNMSPEKGLYESICFKRKGSSSNHDFAENMLVYQRVRIFQVFFNVLLVKYLTRGPVPLDDMFANNTDILILLMEELW